MNTLDTYTRLGFHYYADTQHYRQLDLQRWQPILQDFGVSWLTILAPAQETIPEFFLHGLMEAGVQPIPHFAFSLSAMPGPAELAPFFANYARWGVQQVALFDRPNQQAAWPTTDWGRSRLVERFLDRYIPLADLALSYGLTPIFPPLQPGGDYWDTAFLQSALSGLLQRNQDDILQRQALGAYAWAANHPLDWGAGGPERWPDSRPYHTPPTSQDQLGWRVFDWYLAACQAVLGTTRPIFLLRAGVQPAGPAPGAAEVQTQLQIYQSAAAGLSETAAAWAANTQPLPETVRACCLWLLSSANDAPEAGQAWFQSDGSALTPAVAQAQQWLSSFNARQRQAKSVTFPPGCR